MAIALANFTLDLAELDALLAGFGKQPTTTTNLNPISNEVSVAVSNPAAVTVLDGVQATDAQSIADLGRSSVQYVTILQDVAFAADLAEYLVRPIPEYWFSSIEVLLNAIPALDMGAVAELDIGDQIAVSKRFPNVTNPVVQDLFVEGVEHEITADRHIVRLYCSPAGLYLFFVLDTNELDDVAFGLG
jgi:hypothetical protein